MASRKSKFDALQNAFASANSTMSLTPEGNGGFSLNEDMTPGKALTPSLPNPMKGRAGKPQSPAQHNAVVKAAKTSARKRHARVIGPKGL